MVDQKELDEIIEQLLQNGSKIEAIKVYRDYTKCSLIQAKNHIDHVSSVLKVRAQSSIRESMREQDKHDPKRVRYTNELIAIEKELEDKMIRLIEDKRKIEAIKVYRDYTQSSLNDAKKYVDTLADAIQNGTRVTGVQSTPVRSEYDTNRYDPVKVKKKYDSTFVLRTLLLIAFILTIIFSYILLR